MSLLAAAFLLAADAPVRAVAPDLADMAGDWTVDLRVELADAAYAQPMNLAVAGDGTVTGTFYNSEILAGRAGKAQGRACLAFRTTDGQGLYHTSACLVQGRMVGQTWAEGRGFVLPWTAERR